MLKIERSGKFIQSLDELLFENPDLVLLVGKRIRWFRNNPEDTRLDNHALTKKMSGQWAFSITDDIRITYEWLGQNTIRFLNIGPHSKVYPKKSVKK